MQLAQKWDHCVVFVKAYVGALASGPSELFEFRNCLTEITCEDNFSFGTASYQYREVHSAILFRAAT